MLHVIKPAVKSELASKRKGQKFIKQRLIPYRVLVILLYASNKAVQRVTRTKVTISTGPLSRALRISINRLLDSLKFLEANRYIKGYQQIEKGLYEVTIVEPDGLFKDHESRD